MRVHNRIAAEAETLLDDEVLPGSIAARNERLAEPHIRDLEAWARDVAVRTGESIPSFDPRSGGVTARVLVLREEPRCLADEGSGFVSVDNNDLAAQNTSQAYAASGLDPADALHWNVVPWWIRNPATASEGTRSVLAQARRARADVLTLLDLLDRVQVVLLLGGQAERAWDAIDVDRHVVVTAPHPSPLAWHQRSRSGVRNSELTTGAFTRAAELIGTRMAS